MGVMVTDMDITTLERGLLMPNQLPMPNPLLLLSLDMLMALMVSAMLMVMVLMDTDTPTLMLDTITAKDLLSPLLLLNLDTVMVMVTVTATVMLMASKFILLSFLSNYYNGCVYKKFYDSENFDLRSTVPEVESLAYKKEALVMLSVILCRV